MNLGDFGTGGTIHGKFTTRQSTGAPFTLAGTPVVSVYKDGGTTQSVAGVTLTADFDSVTGLNHFAIDTTADPTFYSNGGQFEVVITTGTVNSISVVGEVVARFNLKAQSVVQTGDSYARLGAPAGASVSADIATVAGYIDTEVGTIVTTTAAIKAKTDNLPTDPADESNTQGRFNTIDATLTTIAGYIDTEVGTIVTTTAAIKAKTDNLPTDPADESNTQGRFNTIDTALSTIAGYIDTEVGTIVTTTAAIKAKTDNLPTDPASTTNITAGTITTVTNLTNAPTVGDLTAAMKTSVTTAATAATPTVAAVTGDVEGNVLGEVAGSVGSVVGLNTALIDATISSRLAATDYVLAPTADENASALLKYDMSTISGEADRSPLNALRVLRNRIDTSTGSLNVYKEDDITVAWNATLTVNPSASPITGTNPG